MWENGTPNAALASESPDVFERSVKPDADEQGTEGPAHRSHPIAIAQEPPCGLIEAIGEPPMHGHLQ